MESLCQRWWFNHRAQHIRAREARLQANRFVSAQIFISIESSSLHALRASELSTKLVTCSPLTDLTSISKHHQPLQSDLLLQVDVLAEAAVQRRLQIGQGRRDAAQLLLDDAHLLRDLVLLGVEQLLRLVLCDLVIALAKGVAVVVGKGGANDGGVSG
jgi:hypothetical protein